MAKKSLFTTLFFLIALGLPLLLQTLGIRPHAENFENKKLEPFPSFSLKRTSRATNPIGMAKGFYLDFRSFQKSYDRYYQDNFVLKEPIFNAYNTIQLELFDKSPIPKKVVIGHDRWLFIGDEFSSTILEAKGFVNFSDDKLTALKQNVQDRKAWLADRGISYYVAVAPEKHTFYSRYLPIKDTGRPTKFQQVKSLLQGSDLNFIDLSVPLYLAPEEKLYYKTDSHWNEYGGFLASKALVDSIRKQYPEAKALNIEEYSIHHKDWYEGDLARMLHVPMADDYVLFQSKNPLAKQIATEVPPPADAYEERFEGSANNLKVLVFRDSFCSSMEKFLTESFGETVLIWSYSFDKELIEKEKPDIVIQEMVERDIERLLGK